MLGGEGSSRDSQLCNAGLFKANLRLIFFKQETELQSALFGCGGLAHVTGHMNVEMLELTNGQLCTSVHLWSEPATDWSNQ